jgi:hypothetical protein
MPNLIPANNVIVPRFGSNLSPSSARRLARNLEPIRESAILRMAAVQTEGMVTGKKMQEIDHACRDAMIGQVGLQNVRDALANGDPLAHDDLNRWVNLAKVAKSEVIADLVNAFSRESL